MRSLIERLGRGVLVGILLLMSVANRGDAQSSIDYSALDANALVARAELLKANSSFSSAERTAVAQRSVDLLSAIGTQQTSYGSLLLSQLAKLAEPALDGLSEENRQALQTALGTADFSGDDPSLVDLHPAYDWLHFQVEVLKQSGGSYAERLQLVKDWVNQVGAEQLSVEMTRWCLHQALPQVADRNSFEVSWIGLLIPPVSGAYRFSVCPFNMNKQLSPQEVVEHSLSVSVAGSQIINATPDQWAWEAAPIELSAGQSVPVQVDLSYLSADKTLGDSPYAVLYWEGPGLARQVVPSSAFTTSTGEQGLAASYRFGPADPTTITRTEPNIEHAWATCLNVAPQDPAFVATLSEALFTHCTNPAYISQLTGPVETRPKHGHVYFRSYFASEQLSFAQRREFLELLNGDAALLGLADHTQILRLFHSFRFGGLERAVGMLGNWLQQFDPSSNSNMLRLEEIHRFYRTIALYLVFRSGENESLETLQRDYLVLPNQECSLPVANVLAYGFQLTGKSSQWTEYLTEKLGDDLIVGDPRVSWLLARATAASMPKVEVRGDQLEQRATGTGRIHHAVADPWLDEAELTAEGEAMQLRVAENRVAHLIALREWTAAQQLVANSNLPAIWQAEIDEREQEYLEKSARRSAASDAAFVGQLQKRLENASLRGDRARADQFQALLSRLQDSEQ